MPKTDWNPLLRDQLEMDYWVTLQQRVAAERTESQVFPPSDQVFSALHLTAFADCRVVILGQDPYHGPGQAHGLCFSVQHGVPPPPSLKNIYKEMNTDLGLAAPVHGNLECWARQGVLLLNTALTVRAHAAASHRGWGWEVFTDRVISVVNNKPDKVVFILWGAHARKKKAMIDTSRHTIVESAHPSPLSAHNGFLGSRPFSTTNDALVGAGLNPIDWQIPSRPSAAI